MTTVCVSGYFTVLHKGHVKLFEEAKKLGDKLIVIINNNKQQKMKKGKLIHNAKDIKYIIERLRMVDKAIISIDKDRSQCATLRKIKPDIFANGGDRHQGNIPEVAVCKELHIKMIDNVGGKKRISSSDILRRGANGS